MGKKISDEQFFELCKQTCGADATWFAFRVFRSVLKERGILKSGERLSESQVALFTDMTILRKEKNLQWREAAEEALTKDTDKNVKLLNFLFDFDDYHVADYDAMSHDAFCDIAKKYGFDLDKYNELENQMGDLMRVLPIAEDAKKKLYELRQFIYELSFKKEYLQD